MRSNAAAEFFPDESTLDLLFCSVAFVNASHETQSIWSSAIADLRDSAVADTTRKALSPVHWL
jgi:hypothetical protein